MRSQRLRVCFAKGPPLRYITHLDLMRFWERALRRAGVALSYSEGFSPHPQISLAAPLPVGVTGAAELMDVFLEVRQTPAAFLEALAPQLPPGLHVSSAVEVEIGLPSIQSLMRAAEYRVALPADMDCAVLCGRVERLLALESLPWQHSREKEVRSYDLRPLLQRLAVCDGPSGATLSMRLQADNTATGRPDQILAALDLPAGLAIERTALILGEPVSPRRLPATEQRPSPSVAGLSGEAEGEDAE